MSVFTTVSAVELRHWLQDYDVGELIDLQGISAGIENTNYFVTTSGGRYVLTLFEKLTAQELPFYLNLMAHLAERGVPSAHPVASRGGSYLGRLNGKPAALVARLEGADVAAPAAGHCAAIGAVLARLHLAGQSYPATMDNPRGPKWWKGVLPEILPFLPQNEAALLQEEIRFQSLYRFSDLPRGAIHATMVNPRGPKWWKGVLPEILPFLPQNEAALLQEEIRFQSLYRFSDLPRGAIHADLFRDNVLFAGERVAGVIDFYFACTDVLLYDVAIAVNDWCIGTDGALDPARTRAFLDAYAAVRPWTPIERGAWPVMLRAGALRFWVSRLYDFHLPRPGELTHAKDPGHFRRILELRIRDEHVLPGLTG